MIGWRLAILAAIVLLNFAISNVGHAAQACASGKITCQDWCGKYRTASGQELCLRLHPAGCMKKYGSLLTCVNDVRPVR